MADTQKKTCVPYTQTFQDFEGNGELTELVY